ncbi:uncharacterized protein LOC113510096 [Galleria mellonella]|uniref:Uncharacterized protein LOC113510096 n=1 Tax=Galleria mellonella TaxID=7137 RepID=A0A6J3C3W6_GALME|nr:uncharacterized protein LOC113510096 [Galleria mellonella]
MVQNIRMSADKNNMFYVECAHIKRVQPEYSIDEAILKEIGNNYRTLPTFAKSVFEQVYIRHYSLNRNKFLACRWEQYKRHIEERTYAPFQFPDIRDLHFHNGTTKYMPSVSLHRIPEFKMRMNCGPGVDSYGQMPIPQELLMKRGQIEKKTKHMHNKNKKKQHRKG